MVTTWKRSFEATERALSGAHRVAPSRPRRGCQASTLYSLTMAPEYSTQPVAMQVLSPAQMARHVLGAGTPPRPWQPWCPHVQGRQHRASAVATSPLLDAGAPACDQCQARGNQPMPGRRRRALSAGNMSAAEWPSTRLGMAPPYGDDYDRWR